MLYGNQFNLWTIFGGLFELEVDGDLTVHFPISEWVEHGSLKFSQNILYNRRNGEK